VDGSVLARSAAVAALSLGLAWLVAAATEEGSLSWGERAGRTLPLTPACAAVGTWVALAPVHAAAQQAVASASLGRLRERVAAAVAGGTLIAWVAAIAIGAVPAVTVTAFFPMAARASAWEWQDNAFVDRAQGLRVGADGTPTFVAATLDAARAAIPRAGRAGAAVATALAGLALPLLVGHTVLARSADRTGRADDRHRVRAGLVAILATAAALVTSAVAFHAAGEWGISALLGAAPSAVLLAFAVARYRASA
jgi:hypothetical protein